MDFKTIIPTILIFILLCNSDSYAQISKRVSADIAAQPLYTALRTIEKQTGIQLAYDYNIIKNFSVKAAKYNNATIAEILTDILSGKNLHFEEKNNVIIITKSRANPRKKTVSGYVEDAKTGERLLGVPLTVVGQNIGTVTNNLGFFSITMNQGETFKLRASYIGFQPADTLINLKDDISITFKIYESANNLNEVSIKATQELPHSTQMSAVDLSVAMIKSMPSFLGEVDIMKAIQLLPGIQAGTEGSSGIYVRGGGIDQNLILLDGVPVYNANHLFGFFSTFNPDAIKNVSVIKGGFPARYGGRLSSVIDLTMKEGNKNKLHGEGGIGLIASRLTLEGPIQKGKSSFMISGRRTYLDVISKPFRRENSDGLYFYDLNGKMNFTLGKKDHLYISGYFGKDKLNDKSSGYKASVDWGNSTAVTRWSHEFSPKIFGTLTGYHSKYDFRSNTNQFDQVSKTTTSNIYSSGIRDKAIKYDLDFSPNPNHSIRTGIGLVHHTYTPGTSASRVTGDGSDVVSKTADNSRIKTKELDIYAEDDFSVTDKLKVNLGLHWTGFWVKNKFYNAIQPRMSMRYLLNERLSVKSSYAQMNQFIHLLTNTSVGLPTDLWVPTSPVVPVQTSHQVSVGLAYKHVSGTEVSWESYYKNMRDIIDYKEGSSFFVTEGWENKIVKGNGKSYGMEILIQKKKGRLTGLIGYTLSRTTRKFPDLNNGQEFPYRYDRRHDMKVAGVYQLAPNIDLSAEWLYGTGSSITLPSGIFKGSNGEAIPIYGQRNSYRMKPFHRADISIKFSKQKRFHERAWVIGIYNVYSRSNPIFIYQDNGQYKQLSLFKIIPSVSYQFKF